MLVRILTASLIESRANKNQDRKRTQIPCAELLDTERLGGAAGSSKSWAKGRERERRESLGKVSDDGRRGSTAGSSRDKAKER